MDGLKANRSRAEDLGNAEDLVHISDSTPQQHVPSNITGNNSWESMRFDADLEHIDMAAIVDSFAFDPSEQPVFDAMGLGELAAIDCTETQVTSNCGMRDDSDLEMSHAVDFDDLIAANEGGNAAFFDSLFGFDAAAS